MLAGPVDRIDGDQPVAAIAEDREPAVGRIAADDAVRRADAASRDLQLRLALIGPEPGNGPVGLLASQQRACGGPRLVRGVLNGFDPGRPGRRAAADRGAVADRDDIVTPRGQAFLHHHPVFAGEAGCPAERDLRLESDSDNGQRCSDMSARGRLHPREPARGIDAQPRQPFSQQQLDSPAPMQLEEVTRGLRGDGARHEPVHGLENGHLHSGPGQARRELQADEAAAHHDETLQPRQLPLDAARIVERAQIRDARRISILAAPTPRPPAGRNRQPGERRGRARRGDDPARDEVDLPDFFVEPQIDGVVPVEAHRPKMLDVIRLARQERLRQRRPMVRHVGLCAEEHDPAVVPLVAQAGRERRARMAGTDDDGALGHQICVAGRRTMAPFRASLALI